MKNLLTKLRYVPKQFAIAAAIVVAGASAVLTYAWGPSRTTFTMENPAPYVTFNSITNNPEYGDEREFLTVRDLTTGQTLGGSTTIVPGHEYLFQVYVHNNAASNLNTAENGYKGIARGTTIEAAVPSTVNGSADAAAYVRATNANPAPGEVWDTVKLTSNGTVTLDYQEGSARLFTKAYASGVQLSDAVMTDTGVKVGYDNLNGDWPGCLQYSGTVTFKVKAVAPAADFTLVKDVRKNGTMTYGQTANVNPGDKVDYRISFKNTGQGTLNNVVIKDTLPQGIVYVPGTAKLSNHSYQYPNMYSLSDKLFTSTGENIGHYLPNGNANVTFTAQVVANDNLPTCGANTLKNIARVETDTAYTTDDADVTVTKTCQPTPAAACKAITPHQISRTEFNFDGSATVENGATVSKYTFVVKNATGTVVKTVAVNSTALTANSGTITLADTGVYTVILTVTTSLGDKTSANCQTTVEVKPETVVPKYVCNYVTVNQISRTQFSFATNYIVENATLVRVDYVVRNATGTEVYRGTNNTYNQTTVGNYTVEAIVVVKVNGIEKTATSANCKKTFEVKPEDKDIQVCRLSDKIIVTIKESAFDSTKYSRNLDDCKPAPAMIKVCELSTWTIKDIKESDFDARKHSKNLEDCKEKVCELSTKTIITINKKDFDASKYSRNLDDCKTLDVKVIRVCELSTKKIVTINESDFNASKYSKTLSDCDIKETPVVIPNTGPEMIAGGLLGSSALGLTLSSYVRSRRALSSARLNR